MKGKLFRCFQVFFLCLLGLSVARAAVAMDPMEYKGYVNKVFGYSLEYPDIFFDGTFEEDGDKVVMESVHKKYHLKAWGRELKKKESAKSLLRSLKADLEKKRQRHRQTFGGAGQELLQDRLHRP